MKTIWLILVFVAGALLPLQAGINGRMGKLIESPVYASFLSFVTGAIVVLLYAMITRQQVVWSGLRSAPPYLWLGGLFGAFYVTIIILAFPKIGPPLTFGLIVAGQMTISIVLDHFHILVLQQHPFNWWKLSGIILIVGGVLLIRKP